MLIDRLMNETDTGLLERMVNFTEARQQVIADDIANVDSPNFSQKDLSVEKFQSMLSEKLEQSRDSVTADARFDDIDAAIEHPTRGILFHDGNNRSMEQLMSDQAKNAMMHQLVVELLRQQYQTLQTALREKVS